MVRLVQDATHAPPAPHGRVVVIGNLDGVHRGHQLVLQRARETRDGRELTVLTFEPHPAAVLGASAPPRLTRLGRKVELLAREGVELVVAQTFDTRFAALTPEAFVDEILVRALHAKIVAVGHDFRFGARRAGDLEVLRTLGATRGFEVAIQEVVADDKGPLSSTRVREALVRGDVDEAHAVLGRPHSIEGTVVSGDKRGRTIGFPTANLGDVEEALPAHGVYAVAAGRSVRATGEYPRDYDAFACGVANVGVRPTVTGGGGHPSVEVHLFDLSEGQRDLYGDNLRVHFLARLRDEKRFPGLDALKAQIKDDAARARALTQSLVRPASGCWY